MARALRIAVGIVTLALMGAGAAAPGHAITSEELRDRLARGDRVPLIDIRSRVHFQRGHIPGAMNIPAAQIATKALPAFREVVIYGDGFNSAEVTQALAHLRSRPGVNADALVGGYAAWSGAGRATSVSQGIYKDSTKYVTLRDLRRIAETETDLVLVDLRGPNAVANLAAEFPRAQLLAVPVAGEEAAKTAPLPINSLRRGAQPDERKLLVLVGDGKRSGAEIVASRLRAAGVRRVAILAGGDGAIEAGEDPVTNVLR